MDHSSTSHLARFYLALYKNKCLISVWLFLKSPWTQEKLPVNSTRNSVAQYRKLLCMRLASCKQFLMELEEHVAWFKLNGSISFHKIICLASLVENKEGKEHCNAIGICTALHSPPAYAWESMRCTLWDMLPMQGVKQGRETKIIMLNSLKYCNFVFLHNLQIKSRVILR